MTIQQESVFLDDARRVIAAREKKASEIGQPMNLAVVDAGGNLVAHIRMDGAWLGSIDISINKAFTQLPRPPLQHSDPDKSTVQYCYG